MTKEEKLNIVPVWEKTTLTVEEAAAYTGIGKCKLRELSEDCDCNFVFWVGNRRMFKRKKLEENAEHPADENETETDRRVCGSH